jgi:hypothetical protein
VRTVRSARPESDGKRDGAAWARKLGSFKRARIGRRGRRARARRRTLAEELRGAEAVDVVHGDAGIRLGAFVRHGERSARGTARRWKWRAPQLRSWKKAHGAQQLVSNKVRVLANFALFARMTASRVLKKCFQTACHTSWIRFWMRLAAPRSRKPLLYFPCIATAGEPFYCCATPPSEQDGGRQEQAHVQGQEGRKEEATRHLPQEGVV